MTRGRKRRMSRLGLAGGGISAFQWTILAQIWQRPKALRSVIRGLRDAGWSAERDDYERIDEEICDLVERGVCEWVRGESE